MRSKCGRGEQVEAVKTINVMFRGDAIMDEEVEYRIGTATRMIGATNRKVLVKKDLSRKTKNEGIQCMHSAHTPI